MSVSTGRTSGVEVRLQRVFPSKGYDKPEFVSCQHHFLDRIQHIAMDEELAGASNSPYIEYFLVKELRISYEEF